MSENYYHWYKSHGIRPNCGRENAADGRVKCLVCLTDDAERQRKRRAVEREIRANSNDFGGIRK